MKTALCVLFLSLTSLGQTVSFTAPKNYYAGVGCKYSIIGDWNGDGQKDIGCISPGILTTHLGNGDGTFQTYIQTPLPYSVPTRPTTFPLSTKQTALAMYIGGGSSIVVPEPVGEKIEACGGVLKPPDIRFACEGSIDIWAPTPKGTFHHKQFILVPAPFNQTACIDDCELVGISNIISGDFNGDGKADLIFAAQWQSEDYLGMYWPYEETYFLPGNGDGTFGEIKLLYQYAPEDISQLITVNNNTVVRFNPLERAGSGSCRRVSNTELDILQISNGSITNDDCIPLLPDGGYFPPVFIGNFNGSLSFLFSASSGTGTSGTTNLTVIDTTGSIIASTTVPGIFNPRSVNRFASHADVAGTYTDPDGSTGVAIFFGNGDGTFNSTPLILPDPPGYTSTNVQVADFNGDNKLDIVASMTSSTKPDELEILLNSSNPKMSTVSVASSLNPSTEGESVTFTATVKPKPLNWPTEGVIFYSGTTKIDKVQLVNGTASISTAKLAPGTHTITAEYSGDCCDYLPNSASLTQVVVK